ncbi:MAG: DNA-3-methyladenine glycosylase [Abditibacteriota bacterium]|nr:DNA-3-methyladenine glycosylase [Abditibacteriota bacterium]
MKRIRISELKDTLSAARCLPGKLLVVNSPHGRVSGVITETEAYLSDDPACHAYRGMTERNRDMFLSPGHIYVYRIYGMHLCVNIVTAPPGVGEAVLIRAAMPVRGIDLMRRRRGLADVRLLARGPANLVKAFGIEADASGSKLFDGVISVYDTEKDPPDIAASPRIGVSCGKELEYRFYCKSLKDFVSHYKS